MEFMKEGQSKALIPFNCIKIISLLYNTIQKKVANEVFIFNSEKVPTSFLETQIWGLKCVQGLGGCDTITLSSR